MERSSMPLLYGKAERLAERRTEVSDKRLIDANALGGYISDWEMSLHGENQTKLAFLNKE